MPELASLQQHVHRGCVAVHRRAGQRRPGEELELAELAHLLVEEAPKDLAARPQLSVQPDGKAVSRREAVRVELEVSRVLAAHRQREQQQIPEVAPPSRLLRCPWAGGVIGRGPGERREHVHQPVPQPCGQFLLLVGEEVERSAARVLRATEALKVAGHV